MVTFRGLYGEENEELLFSGHRVSIWEDKIPEVEVTADMVTIAKELELEVELENVTELLQFYDTNLMDEELCLGMSKESGFWFV